MKLHRIQPNPIIWVGGTLLGVSAQETGWKRFRHFTSGSGFAYFDGRFQLAIHYGGY